MQIQPDPKQRKVESAYKKKQKASSKSSSETKETSFAKQLSSTGKESIQDSLDELMTVIEDAGVNLLKSPTDANLSFYKESVKAFMNKALNQSYVFEQNFDVHNRLYIVVREVDKQLIALTDHLINKQYRPMELIARLQEIKGMLLDMYI